MDCEGLGVGVGTDGDGEDGCADAGWMLVVC